MQNGNDTARAEIYAKIMQELDALGAERKSIIEAYIKQLEAKQIEQIRQSLSTNHSSL